MDGLVEGKGSQAGSSAVKVVKNDPLCFGRGDSLDARVTFGAKWRGSGDALCNVARPEGDPLGAIRWCSMASLGQLGLAGRMPS